MAPDPGLCGTQIPQTEASLLHLGGCKVISLSLSMAQRHMAIHFFTGGGQNRRGRGWQSGTFFLLEFQFLRLILGQPLSPGSGGIRGGRAGLGITQGSWRSWLLYLRHGQDFLPSRWRGHLEQCAE